DIRASTFGFGDELLDRVSGEVVVGVEKEHVFAGRMLDAAISRRAGARVALLEQDDTRIFPAPALQLRHRVVAAAVVDAEDLEAAVGLPDCARDTLVDVFGDVVAGDDDRYGRRHSRCLKAPVERRSDRRARRVSQRRSASIARLAATPRA